MGIEVSPVFILLEKGAKESRYFEFFKHRYEKDFSLISKVSFLLPWPGPLFKAKHFNVFSVFKNDA